MALDRYGLYRPVAPPAWLAGGPGAFARTCPFSPLAADEDVLAAELFADAPRHHPATGRFRAAYVGAVAEPGFRERGSSGGLASWLLAELLATGAVDGVAHVVPVPDPRRSGRFFEYRVSRTVDEVLAGAKSRYYPVELSGVLREIGERPGRYALVGVPCFIKAVQLLRREDPVLRNRIRVTLGLFCGHMKSAGFVESLAWQMGVRPRDVAAVEHRVKDPTRPASTYTAELTLYDGRRLRRDWSDLADGDWGAGFFQSPACNYCDDVVAEAADVSVGDAWVEPYELDGRGTNVVVVRSAAVDELIRRGIAGGRLQLQPVDGDFVERTQEAGLRQRRQGLAYRLTWRRRGLTPVKRVAPDRSGLSLRRRAVYRSRWLISYWSHRVLLAARLLRTPGLYVRWARLSLAVYQGFTYHRGRLGRLLRRLIH